MTPNPLPRGLNDRTREPPSTRGQIREKRGDTQVGTLRKEYGDNFAKGYRSDTHLGYGPRGDREATRVGPAQKSDRLTACGSPATPWG
jgi:hypothetical protein